MPEQVEHLALTRSQRFGELFDSDEHYIGPGERGYRPCGQTGLADHQQVGGLHGREHRTQPRSHGRRRSHDEHPRWRHAACPNSSRRSSRFVILPPRMTLKEMTSPARARVSNKVPAYPSGFPAMASKTSPTIRPALSATPPVSTPAITSPVVPASRCRDTGTSTGKTPIPSLGRRSPATQAFAALLGIESAIRPNIMALMATTSPLAFRSGPPEFPGARATSDLT